MTRAAVQLRWKPKAHTPGQWGGYCGGEGCGRRLAEYRPGRKEPLSMEPGYVNVDGIFRRRHRPRYHYVTRGKTRRALSAKLSAAGYPFPLDIERAFPPHIEQTPPSPLNPHPKLRMPVFGHEYGTLALCFDCGALNEVQPPPEGFDMEPTVC